MRNSENPEFLIRISYPDLAQRSGRVRATHTEHQHFLADLPAQNCARRPWDTVVNRMVMRGRCPGGKGGTGKKKRAQAPAATVAHLTAGLGGF